VTGSRPAPAASPGVDLALTRSRRGATEDPGVPRRNSPPAPLPAIARHAGLVHVSDQAPGIRRRRAGKGFAYRDPEGRPVRDPEVLQRIRSLAIPPAYTDVWICPLPDGHLQATGRDARRRKQYRYHPDWAQVRGDGKFERLVAFAKALPQLRRRLRTDLARPGFPREKVLAIVVAVMARTLERVGNVEYARSNRSYGLTTLRNHHLEFLRGGRARLKFRGKSGLERDVEIDDQRLARLVRACRQLPGQALFQYRDDDGALQPVGSAQVNDYLRDAMGAEFTAKDFRTWGGTLVALQRLARTPLPERRSERALAQLEKEMLAEVAATLGNTPAVCRKAYVDPCVVAAWREERLLPAANVRGPRQWEEFALRLLRREHARATPAPARKAGARPVSRSRSR